MNTRRKPAIREDGAITYDIIPPRGETVSIVCQEDMNKVVPPQEISSSPNTSNSPRSSRSLF